MHATTAQQHQLSQQHHAGGVSAATRHPISSRSSRTPFQPHHHRPEPQHNHHALLSSRRGTVLLTAGAGAGLWVAGGVVAAAGAAAAAAAAGIFGGENPQALVRTGMQKFRKDDVEGSVQDFDRALALQPQLRPYLWQRGLSLYYLKEYQEAATQFRDDVAVNPNDTEESIWAFLCEAQLQGPDAARQKMLKVGRDSRPVMRAAYECFKTQGCSPETILQARGPGDEDSHDSFYAWLYVGLWHEAHGDAGKAQEAMGKAVQTQYAKQSGDYMAALAVVHCQRRGWAVDAA